MKRAWLAAAVLLVPLPAAATLLSAWSLDEVARRADRVVLGTVGAQRSLRVDGALMTETTVRVERTLFGARSKSLVLSQLGGREGTLVSDLVGDARLTPGQRVLLFTYGHRDGRRYLVGMSLGAYLVDGSVAAQRIEVPLVDASGNVLPPPGERRTTLAEIEQALARVHR